MATGGHVYYSNYYYSNYADQRLYDLGARRQVDRTDTGWVSLRRLCGGPTCRRVQRWVDLRPRRSFRPQERSKHSRADPFARGGWCRRRAVFRQRFCCVSPLSRDGRRLAFIAWNHPNMPLGWNRVEGGRARQGRLGRTDDGCRRSGRVGPRAAVGYRWHAVFHIGSQWVLEPVCEQRPRLTCRVATRAEFASPLWTLGQANYVLMGDGHAVARFSEQGIDRLAVIDLRKGSARVLDLPYVEFSQLARLDAGHIAALVGSVDAPPAIMRIDIVHASAKTLRSAGSSRCPGSPSRLPKPLISRLLTARLPTPCTIRRAMPDSWLPRARCRRC